MENLWILVDGIPTPLKNMSSSIGMMTFPRYGTKKNMFQSPPTRHQLGVFPKMAYLTHKKGRLSGKMRSERLNLDRCRLPGHGLGSHDQNMWDIGKKQGLEGLPLLAGHFL